MINASVVIYKHSPEDIQSVLQSLKSSPVVHDIFIIDNSPVRNNVFDDGRCVYIFNGKNPGFGAAHNIALRKTIEAGLPYHLVINPDIHFKSEILEKIVNYADNHADTGHIMPLVLNPDGTIQYLCKLIPTPSDLIFRRFLQGNISKKRMEKFEMRNTGYDKIMEVPYLSGCFMFLRTDALVKVGLFDERFFMYPEDIDLTRRIHRHYKTIFFPEVSVIHEHTRSSYKNFRMFLIHLSNLVRYFNKWGWLFDKERKLINQKIINQKI
jgi:hypothetical protein